MVNSSESIQREVIKICEECYESCEDNNSYFIAKGQTSCDVRKNILSRLSPENSFMRLLDTVVYIMDVNGDTFINVV